MTRHARQPVMDHSYRSCGSIDAQQGVGKSPARCDDRVGQGQPVRGGGPVPREAGRGWLGMHGIPPGRHAGMRDRDHRDRPRPSGQRGRMQMGCAAPGLLRQCDQRRHDRVQLVTAGHRPVERQSRFQQAAARDFGDSASLVRLRVRTQHRYDAARARGCDAACQRHAVAPDAADSVGGDEQRVGIGDAHATRQSASNADRLSGAES